MSISTQKKRLVAELRGGDYTHPGDESIIPLVMAGIDYSASNRILDAGSGLGGTAQQLTRYGRVVGIDIDKELLSYSHKKYTDVDFINMDVHDICDSFNRGSFNVAVLFSSFYAFENQHLACQSLAHICQPESKLRILDYSTSLTNFTNPFHNNTLFKPINKNTIKSVLECWEIDQIRCVTDIFESDYTKILSKMKTEKSSLQQNYGKDAFYKVFSSFQQIHSFIINGDLSGSIIYASLRK